MTGLVVYAAMEPGSAAESPAIAMKTSASEPLTSCATLSGVRCADATAMSNGTPSAFRTLIAFSATGKSLLLPEIMKTLAIGTTMGRADNNLGRWGTGKGVGRVSPAR